MKKPDNIVFDYKEEKYDAFKKDYPTSFNSKNFELEEVRDIKLEAQPYFESEFLELKEKYDKFVTKLEWNKIIHNAKFNFNPIIGKEYHLYEDVNSYFLSIIKPNEWKMKFIGTFILRSNFCWDKVEGK